MCPRKPSGKARTAPLPRSLRRSTLALINERLSSALATADLGVWTVNFVTGELFLDARMKIMFGLAPDEEITVAEAETFIHPYDRYLSDELLYSSREPNSEIQWEWRIVRRDGEVRWHDGRGRLHRDADGRLISGHGVARDITNRKRAQAHREHLAAIVESSEDAIASATLAGIVTSWNRGAEAIFGYSAAEIVGRSVDILSPPELCGEMETFIGRIARGEAVERYKAERLTKDKRRLLVSVSLSPMHGDSGQVIGVSVIARDVTRANLLEERLREAEKMEAIGQLAGGIAHDFNNLLTIVNGCAELALKDSDDPRLCEQLTAIRAAGERAAALTSRLLAFGRKQILQLEIVDIGEIALNMLPLLRRAIAKEIECVMEISPALNLVKADRHQIEQVLLNLVVNAGDALAGAGRILISARNVLLDGEYPAVAPGRYAALTVADNGPGIDPEVRRRIFEPFFTTKPVGKGTGLGLAVVYGIASQTRGHVTCESEPGVGTEFTVYLPAAPEKTEVPAPAKPETALSLLALSARRGTASG